MDQHDRAVLPQNANDKPTNQPHKKQIDVPRRQGVALVPEAYLDLEGRDVDLQVLEAITEPNETGLYLIWPKRLTAQETHQTVREWLCRSFET